MSDKVFIEGLEIDALIGIHEWERRIRQPLVFDIEMTFDNRVPAATDAIADALDYAAVCARMRELVGASGVLLLETLAERCCVALMREYPMQRIRLRVAKPQAVPGTRRVGIEIVRERTVSPELP